MPPVLLRVYDLTAGSVKLWSPFILGRKVEGVWHTGVEYNGWEYFYGGQIIRMKPKNVEDQYAMTLSEVHFLGNSSVLNNELREYIKSIRKMFTFNCYDLERWNCNHFSDHLVRFLTGKSIPSYVLHQAQEMSQHWVGKCLIYMIKKFSGGQPLVGIDDQNHPRFTLNQMPRINKICESLKNSKTREKDHKKKNRLQLRANSDM